MSASSKERSEKDAMQRCASCGVAGGDGIELKRCNACYLVRYCSVKCQKEHRPKHKKECKKRAAELRDEILFKQPDSNCFGDCPICCLPLPNDQTKTTMSGCCSKQICDGCAHANQKREREGRLQNRCPFCRKAAPKTDEECMEQLMKRVEANDRLATRQMGRWRYQKEDYKGAFDYWTRAAALGDVPAHFQLSSLYHTGQGVEKDEKKELHYLKEAAIGGHPTARHNLGCIEARNCKMDRAAKHWIIAANLGYDDSLNSIKVFYRTGLVSKDDFTSALRGYQAATAATKSPQREEAANRKAAGGSAPTRR